MNKRLQVLVPPEEFLDIQRLAERESLTMGGWVRCALREARNPRPVSEPQKKLKAIRRAVTHSFPTGDIGIDSNIPSI